ncbi:MAG: hypothetical protein C5B60_05160 [Chloroflexi bacterium]|nr:MAG: hypothetical protein C5B60_05160 [Chloroflexota bacterium]
MAKHKLYVLNRAGHTALAEWDPKNKVEIKTAEEVFGDLQKKDFHMFDASTPQETKQELTEFDPKTKEIVAFSQLEGGD